MGLGVFLGGYMTEKQKMLSGDYYNHYDKELTEERATIAEKLATYNNFSSDEEKKLFLGNMLGKIGKDVEIKTPFMCDYGYNIELGSNVFLRSYLLSLSSPLYIHVYCGRHLDMTKTSLIFYFVRQGPTPV